MKFFWLFICLCAIEASFALKCKRCKDKNDNDCKEVEDESCATGNSPDREPACLTLIYKGANKNITEKMCVVKIKNKDFECQIPPNTKQEKCITCMEDGCNEKSGATSLSVATLAVVATVVIQRLL